MQYISVVEMHWWKVTTITFRHTVHEQESFPDRVNERLSVLFHFHADNTQDFTIISYKNVTYFSDQMILA